LAFPDFVLAGLVKQLLERGRAVSNLDTVNEQTDQTLDGHACILGWRRVGLRDLDGLTLRQMLRLTFSATGEKSCPSSDQE
jgi:hypothetical protein